MRIFTELFKLMLINNNTYVPAFFSGDVFFILMPLFMLLYNLIFWFDFLSIDGTSLFTENPLFLENPFLPQFIGVFMSSVVRHLTAYTVCLYYFDTFPSMSSAQPRPDNAKITQCHLYFNNKKALTLFGNLICFSCRLN